MAKTSGLGMEVVVDDSTGTPQDISNDVTSLQWATPRGVQDVTGVDKEAVERLALLADMSLTLNIVFNPATGMSHDVFKSITTGNIARTTTISLGTTTGDPQLACEILYTDLPYQRSQAGELTAAVPGALADGTPPTWGTHT